MDFSSIFEAIGRGGGGMGRGYGGTFEARYRCYPVAFIQRPELENGGKILLPPSALDTLTHLNIQYPMLFQLTNPSHPEKRTHCGPLEFIAEEGHCYLPYWMMQNLLIQEGGFINVKSATLPLGTYVKIQPHTSNFLDISNHRAVLERALRNFACLTKDDVIAINYNNKIYYLTVLEVKPKSNSNGVSIIETDMEVDFEKPLDYKEPEPVSKPVSIPQPVAQQSSSSATSIPKVVEPGSGSNEGTPVKTAPISFQGSGYRLDGRPSSLSSSPATNSSLLATSPPGLSTSPAAKQTIPTQAGNKVVFGKQPAAPAANEKQAQPAPTTPQEPTFKSFVGKGVSLSGKEITTPSTTPSSSVASTPSNSASRLLTPSSTSSTSLKPSPTPSAASSSTSTPQTNKLAFGSQPSSVSSTPSNSATKLPASSTPSAKPAPPAADKEKENDFKAFTGKGHSLR